MHGFGRWGCLGPTFGHRGASWRCPPEIAPTRRALFCWKMAAQVSIWGSHENRKSLQNHTLEDRRALWTAQKVKKEGFGSHLEIRWKNDRKKGPCGRGKSSQNTIGLFKITLSASSEKVEKSMQNGPPKVVIFHPKSTSGRPRVD